LRGLRRICADVRFLGSYPRVAADGDGAPRTVRPPGTAEADFADAEAWLAHVRAGEIA
jgi:prephenate dehydratase